MTTPALLGVWTVYDHPADYPGGFLARLHEVLPGGATRVTEELVCSPTLDGVRARLPPGLYRSARFPSDHPTIVETWI